MGVIYKAGKVIWSAPSAAPPVTPASLPCRLHRIPSRSPIENYSPFVIHLACFNVCLTPDYSVCRTWTACHTNCSVSDFNSHPPFRLGEHMPIFEHGWGARCHGTGVPYRQRMAHRKGAGGGSRGTRAIIAGGEVRSTTDPLKARLSASDSEVCHRGINGFVILGPGVPRETCR